MLLNYILLILGLVALYQGGEMLVKGCVTLSQHFKLSAVFISAIIIGFGTSLPEFSASFIAAYRGNSGIAVGNVVGSNIANILFVFALAIALSPFSVKITRYIKFNLCFLVFSFIITYLAARLWGNISLAIALVMLAGFLIYLLISLKISGDDTEDLPETVEGQSPWRIYTLTIVGFMLLIGGAQLTVEYASIIAQNIGVPESIIATSIIAFGTSLPEVVTIIIATRRHLGDVVVGNILGSCIFNLLAVLGFTRLIAPLPFEANLIQFDAPIMLGAGVICVLFVLMRKNYRFYGISAIISYCTYIIFNFSNYL